MKLSPEIVTRFQFFWRAYAQEDLDHEAAKRKLRELIKLIRNSFTSDYPSRPSPYHDRDPIT